jgi:hypothetical protein
MTEIHDRATALLLPIWAGIQPEYKSKYKFTIWRQFEDQVRSAAYTTTLSLFLSRICSRLNVTLHDDALTDICMIVRGGQDREVLRVLRDESAYIVTRVRLANEAKHHRKDRT